MYDKGKQYFETIIILALLLLIDIINNADWIYISFITVYHIIDDLFVLFIMIYIICECNRNLRNGGKTYYL